MEPRERVLTALNHKKPDKCPINFRATTEIIESLKKHLDKNYEELLDYFQVDFREVIPEYRGPKIEKLDDGSSVDIWGVARKEKITKHSRDEIVTHSPLKEVSKVDDVIQHEWPSAELFDFSQISSQCDNYEGYAISTPGIHVSGYHGVFHLLTYLFGMEKALINLVTEKNIMHKSIEKIMDFLMAYYERLFASAEGKIDFLFYKDDFGSQNNLLISRDMFKEYFASTLQRLAHLAEKFNAHLILHSCGSVVKLIPDFIDLGVKVLDPIQTSAKGMEIEKLSDDFAEELVFHGGIDTQSVLPKYSPDKVKEVVTHTIDILGCQGGYFFSPSHRIQQDTPIDNIIAMYEAANGYTY